MDFESLVGRINQVQDVLQAQAAHAINLALTARNWLVGYYIVEFEQNGGKTGRLISVVDGSGSVDYNYDALDNIIDETRTIAVPNSDNVYQFQMNYSYDSWGRMLQMTYPDGEKVNYTYQWGGDLRSMNGNNVYIDSIRYNPFGQRSAIHYGNGTHVEYTYDDLHRLVNLTSYTSDGTPMQQINYTFDSVSNVTSIVNNAGTVNSLGGGYKNNYHYDNLYRLTSSGGGGETGNYNMGMGYTPSGRIIWKRKNAESVTLADDAYMHYSYCDDYQPHAVRHIFDEENMTHCDLRWDPAGNLGQISVSLKDNVFDHGRFLFWTVDNRMHAAVDDKHYSYYTYDYTGGSCGSREQSQACLSYAEMEQRRRSQRRLKLTGESHRLDVNADFMTTGTLLNTPTLYPSAYLVLTSKGYTKHYYAGADRVAASLGGGRLNAVGSNPGMQERADWLFWESHERVNGRMLQENDHECIWQSSLFTQEYYESIKDIPGRMNASVEFKLDDFHKNLEMLADEQHDEKDVYFYHSDHLGSASWITDGSGIPVQHLQYLPFGEPFVDQHPAGYQERFRFTGKERDEETGYGYFGARYMDHELTAMWLSVDPMSDKYPGISPYAYCAWNPVKLVDPDGNEAIDNDDGWKIDRHNKTITRVSTEGGDNFQYINDNGSTRNLIGSQSDVTNQYGDFTLIDNVQNRAQLSQTEDKNISSDLPGAGAGATIGFLGYECNKTSKKIFDYDNGKYMGKDGSTKVMQKGKNGGLNGRYKSQIKASTKYAKFGRVCTVVGIVSAIGSAKNTESQFHKGQISNMERLTNHAIDIVGCTPVGFLAPLAYELGAKYGPSTWFKK